MNLFRKNQEQLEVQPQVEIAAQAEEHETPASTPPVRQARCPVCLEDFDQLGAVWISGVENCGHQCCVGCAEIIKNGPNPKCPICRKPVSSYIRLMGTY